MAETGTWSTYHITGAGRNLRQRCIADGKTPVFTRAAIGEGKPSDPAAIDMMTGLVAYARDVVIKKSYAVEANHLCIIRVDNSGYTQDVLATEVAVFARTEDQEDSAEILYGYAYIPNGYVLIPQQTSSTNRKVYEITLDTYLSQATEIKIIFDGSTLFVSHADLDDALAVIQAQLANIVETDAITTLLSNIPRIKVYPLELPVAKWQAEDAGGYYCEVDNEILQEVHHVKITFNMDSLDTAAICGLSPEFEVLDGKIRFRSDNVPDTALTGEYVVVAENGGFMGGRPDYEAYTASNEEIGALLSKLN